MEAEEGNNPKRFNSMMSMWYGLIIGALQGYLVVQNVWKFVRYVELPWPLQKTPSVELNVYIGMTGLAVLLLPFFLSACFLKIGNLANDNQMLGKRLQFRDDWTKLLVANKLQDVKSLLVTLWQHCGPISSLIHLICAVSLLFPQILMESVLVKNGFLSSQHIWKTDLDLMLRGSADLSFIKSLPSENGVETRVFPVPTPQRADGLSLEFINYAIALFVFSVRYAQVFWECHKSFSIVFGMQQIVSTVHTLISLCSFSLLYKVHLTNAYGDSQATIPFLLDGYITLLLHAITSTILFLSAAVMYHLGFLKFTAFVQEKIRTVHVVTKGNDSSSYGMGWQYFPHSAAVSIALALAATQSPLVHDAYLLYQLSSNKLMILYAVSTVAHFLSWIVLWLVLTFTGTWNFRINAVMFQPIEGLDSVGLSAQILIDRKTDVPMNPFSSSLLVVCEGRAFPVDNLEDKRSILSVIPRPQPPPQQQQPEQQAEPIYWKKPQVTSPLPSCMSSKSDGWTKEHKGIKYMAVRKEVTFDDELHSPRYYSPSQREKSGWKSPTPNRCYEGNEESSRDFDSGEYACLSGGRGSILKKFLADNHESAGKCRSMQEHLYSTNPLAEERKLVSSPVPTVDSSSGVSSAGSHRSNMGPPSSTPSCSQYSEGSYSEKRNSNNFIVEPSAHYEPAPVRGISRRSSMRVTPCSPIYETKSPVSKEYPMIGKCLSSPQQQQQHIHDSGIYGKLRWDNSPAAKCSPNYEAIYGKTRRQSRENEGPLRSPCVNEMREQDGQPKEIIVENLRRPDVGKNNMSDSISELCPPIPPPLPVLSTYHLSRQNSISSNHSPYGTTTARNTGILMSAPQTEPCCQQVVDYTSC